MSNICPPQCPDAIKKLLDNLWTYIGMTCILTYNLVTLTVDKKRTNFRLDKFWTDCGHNIFSKLAIAHSICPGIVHHNVVLEWAESGPWVGCAWAEGGPWMGHGQAMGGPWVGHIWAVVRP